MTRDLSNRDLALALVLGAIGLIAALLVFQQGTQAAASVASVGPAGSVVPRPASEPRSPAEAPAPVPKPDGLRLPPDGTPTLTVNDGATVALHSSPGGDVVAELGSETEFGGQTVLSVAERQGNWAGVPTQLLPNGELGWVRIDSPGLEIDSVGVQIVVDLSDMRAELRRDGKLEHAWQVSIGSAESPTPVGHFSITDVIEGGLNPVYGCCALALSATQPNLPPGWTGGNRMAIHGTSEALGQANSSGCVRSAEDDLQLLVERVPLGTPVLIQE